MKKLICLILSLVCLSGMLISCEEDVSDLRAPVQKVQDQIKDLPNPIVSNNEDLTNVQGKVRVALEDYEKLSEDEKIEVTNYNRLLTAIELVEYSEAKIKAREAAEASIKKDLLNPSSMIVNSYKEYIYKIDDIFYVVTITDYSAQNKAGGYGREEETIFYKYKATTPTSGKLTNVSKNEFSNIACDGKDPILFGEFKAYYVSIGTYYPPSWY